MFTHAGAGMVKFIRCMQVQVLYITGIIVSHGCRYGWYYPEVTFSLPSLAHSDVLKPVGRRFLRHPSGPKFISPRGRISGLRVKKSPRLSYVKVQVCGRPVSWGCGAAVYGWG